MLLRRDLQPMRDYQLAKRYAWNPAALDFMQDRKDWPTLNPREQDTLCNQRLTLGSGK